MNKKLLTTSALAGVVALAGSAFAETKVSGNLEYVFNSASATTAAASSQGQGFEDNIQISSSKDTDFGKLSYGFRLENASTEGAHLTLTNENTTVQIGADSFTNLSATVVPNTGEAFQTIIQGVGAVAYEIAYDLGESDSNTNARKNGIGLGVAQKFDGGTLSLRYVPNTAQGNTTNPGTTDNSGTSAVMAKFQGNLGVEGLNVMLGYAKDKASGATAEDGKATTYGAAYTINGITIGAQRKNFEQMATAATQDEYKTNEYGIGFAVNDNLSVALQHIVTDGDLNGTDFAKKEKITGIGIGYNLGGIALELSYGDVNDANGVDGSDGEAFQLKTVQSF
jgi:hypothetical protein